jgi:DHA3 family multidrug efflux protein-like MFS transporter
MTFTLREWGWLYVVGIFAFMAVIPAAEAAEQTIMQRVVPFRTQGRVFGFAQSVEQSAAPLTAFLIGPLTQFGFIPFMTDGAGADAIGDWFGRGPDRGIALVFVLAGVAGLLTTLLALASRYYRQLSQAFDDAAPAPALDGAAVRV